MQESQDNRLLEEFAHGGSEEAFGELVRRHMNLVYSAALRHVGNPGHAEEITQAVFIILARKAGRLGGKIVLSGWLYQTARLTSANFLKTERHRVQREQEALMRSTLNESEPDVWTRIAPLLDTALGGLSEKDRDAVVLRYFDGRKLGEVGAALGTSEAGATNRVNRAVEKLRRFFAQRGLELPAAVLTSASAAHSVQAAPVALTACVTGAALAQGAAVSGATLTLIEGTLKLMAWTKLKTAVATGVTLMLATGTTTVIVKARRANHGPPIALVKQVNTGLPAAQTEAKTLIFSAHHLGSVPATAHWCEALNTSGKLWSSTPATTVFALNSKVAGLPLANLPGDTVVFFETSHPGWNQAGGRELLAKNEAGVAVALAGGSALIVTPGEIDSLRWNPQE